jgi:hypothetical protein
MVLLRLSRQGRGGRRVARIDVSRLHLRGIATAAFGRDRPVLVLRLVPDTFTGRRGGVAVNQAAPFIDTTGLFIDGTEFSTDGTRPFLDGNEPFIDAQQFLIDEKELFIDGREVFVDAKESFIDTKEFFIEEKERGMAFIRRYPPKFA